MIGIYEWEADIGPDLSYNSSSPPHASSRAEDSMSERSSVEQFAGKRRQHKRRSARNACWPDTLRKGRGQSRPRIDQQGSMCVTPRPNPATQHEHLPLGAGVCRKRNPQLRTSEHVIAPTCSRPSTCECASMSDSMQKFGGKLLNAIRARTTSIICLKQWLLQWANEITHQRSLQKSQHVLS